MNSDLPPRSLAQLLFPEHPFHPMLQRRTAFTLVELLVVIAIIGILVGLLAPSLQSLRESSRRSGCQSNLIPIGFALHNYHDRWTHFPVGTIAESGPIVSEPSGNHHNWLGRLTDLLDQPVIASHIDRSESVYAPANREVLELRFPGVQCPSATQTAENASSYVGLHHSTEKQIDEQDNGVFRLNLPVSRNDVADGLTNTALVSEKLCTFEDLGWLSGTRATLRNAGGGIESSVDPFESSDKTVVGSMGSQHPAGAHVLLGSGSIQFLSDQTDQRVLQQLVDRSDGEIPLNLQSIESQRRQNLR